MATDPFDPLRRVDPPDQWDDIAARADEADSDALPDEAPTGSRRRAVAVLAVAAALVLVIGGIALARTGDDDGELTATDGPGRSTGSVIPGACPFFLEPGPGIPALSPDPLPSVPSAAIDPPTVGSGMVGEEGVTVAVSTFPSRDVQRRARWSTTGEGVAIGWFEEGGVLPTDQTAVSPSDQEPGGTTALLIVSGGGHLGGADQRCRDVYVQVTQPDPPASADTVPPPSASTTTAAPTTSGAAGGDAPRPGPTTTVTGQPGAPDRPAETTPPTAAPGAPGAGDPSTTTTTTAPGGNAGSCVSTDLPCDDTTGTAVDAPDDRGDADASAGQEANALIDTMLDAIRFPEPGADGGGDDTATEDRTAVPGECPFSLDPAAGLPVLEAAPDLGLERSTRVDYPDPTVGRASVDGIDLTVAVTTMPPSDAQQQPRWVSLETGRAVGWVDGYSRDNGVDEDGTEWLIQFSGGHLGGPDEGCRDVLAWARVDDTAAVSIDGGRTGTAGEATTTKPDQGLGPTSDVLAADHVFQVARRVMTLLRRTVGAVRFPLSDPSPPSPLPPTTASRSIPPTTAPPTGATLVPSGGEPGPQDFGGTLPDGRRFGAAVTGTGDACLTLDGRAARPGESVLGCVRGDSDPSTLGQLVVDGTAGAPDDLLILGHRPRSAVETHLLDVDGDRIDGPVATSPDGTWFAAWVEGTDFVVRAGSASRVVHLDAAGDIIDVG